MRREHCRLLVTLLLTASCAEPSGPAADGRPRGAQPSPPSGQDKIAFVSDRSGDFEIYTMNPDGSGLTDVSNDPGADFQPAWSPDRSQIAFSRVDLTGNQNVWIMNADGTEQHRITTVDGDGTGLATLAGGPNDQASPHWEPNGHRVAFMGETAPVGQANLHDLSLYLINQDGTGLTQLTTPQGNEWFPRWSPDGLRILFNLLPPRGGSPGLYVINPDGTGLTRLFKLAKTTEPNVTESAGWSPDGQRLAVMLCKLNRRSFACDIATVNLDGTNLTNLTADNPGFDGNADWR
jgi:TolB protein